VEDGGEVVADGVDLQVVVEVSLCPQQGALELRTVWMRGSGSPPSSFAVSSCAAAEPRLPYCGAGIIGTMSGTTAVRAYCLSLILVVIVADLETMPEVPVGK